MIRRLLAAAAAFLAPFELILREARRPAAVPGYVLAAAQSAGIAEAEIVRVTADERGTVVLVVPTVDAGRIEAMGLHLACRVPAGAGARVERGGA